MPKTRQRKQNLLTARAVETAKDAGRYSDGSGLYLAVRPGGSRQWVFIYRRDGKLREMGFGSPLKGVTLAMARGLRDEVRAVISRGGDPLNARRQAEQSETGVPTFGAYALALVERIEEGFSNPKHRQQWRNTLQTYCKPIWALPIDEVDTSDVLACLTPIWQTKPESASRVRARIERVLNAARAERLRSGENPAAWRGHLDATLPKPAKLTRGHHAALAYTDVLPVMSDLRARPAPAARALELAVLTATRTSEVLKAKWAEFDLEASLWTIPAERMKARREHRVALSKRALAIVKELSMARSTEFVFPGQKAGKPLSNMAMLMLLERMGRRGMTTSHGFRSTFSDWASEVSPFSSELRETALAHTIGNKAEAAYRWGDALEKRRAMMEAWATWCEPKEPNVVAFARPSGPA
ncbi:MAG TPA: integrase arm-type DNA-binding domain-containing protein [Roseiarcus sp.]|jgi:integrase|nr:integrase arm-type DNA-binding domain-containing protein [Roseiarcus sp.]